LHDISKAKLAREFDTDAHVTLLNKLADVVPLLLRNGNSKSAKTTPKLDNATLRSIRSKANFLDAEDQTDLTRPEMRQTKFLPA
jgi:hypothetical protein